MGNAWLIGVVAGLADAGLDATAADLIVGTSAGATAAAQNTGTSPAQLFDDVISSAVSGLPPRSSRGGGTHRLLGVTQTRSASGIPVRSSTGR
jgi:NTE family protein